MAGFLVLLGFGCSTPVVEESIPTIEVESAAQPEVGLEEPKPETAVEDYEVYVTFTLNTQDFAYPEKSAEILERVLDLHEQLAVPLDVYLTTTMVDEYVDHHAVLFARLKASPVATVNYHIRPPVPYHNLAYDLVGVGEQTGQTQYDTIKKYESYGLDLVTGKSTTLLGSFAKIVDALGQAPLSVGAAASAGTGRALHQVFKDMGATFVVDNDGSSNFGEMRDGLYVRPQHADIKLFELVGQDPTTIFVEAEANARAATDATAPYFLNVKMHDNDFFAENSAWTTVYLAKGARRNGPPYETSLKSELLTDQEAEAVWLQYEATVTAASQSSVFGLVNLRDVKTWLAQ